VKDLCDVAGTTTTAGSVALKANPPAQHDAPVVARLRAAGAVIVGATTMTEFAMGAPGINPHYGTPLSPWDRATGRIPGGSSSGAGVSVADGMVWAALGSDTAGSVRVPAAFCNLAGFKPTARRVPLAGSIPLAGSLDSIGPLARSVACCAMIDAVFAGEPVQALSPLPLRGLRLGVPRNFITEGIDAQVAAAFSIALKKLSAAGALVVEFDFNELTEMTALNKNFSFSVVEGHAWHRDLLARAGELYDPIIAGRFRSGANVSAADYILLCEGRRELALRSAVTTRDFDAVLMPTVHILPPPVAELAGNEPAWLAANRQLIRNPHIANFLDRCALTLPCNEPGAAPVGLTLMGETMRDHDILRIGIAVENLLTR